MPTLLHISDLHRTSDPRPSNEELLAAISSDSVRWKAEGIPRPELIVVSGDLIQGVKLGVPEADAKIVDQYREANDFLTRLGAEFVNSDRSRIVVVPGNHDVNWNRAHDGMTPIETCPEDMVSKAFVAGSGVRWDWKERQAYEISDERRYESRYEHFRQFLQEFYCGITPSPLSYQDSDLFFLEYPDLELLVLGFSSWHGNDCFCGVGEIKPTALALSQQLLAKSKMATAVAVWHHSIVGGPREHDYMDQRVVHRLVDFGFNVGLHGHQHFPGAAPFELRLPNLTSLAVVGAGSLAVGDNELPMGERRQFNIVVVDPDRKSITVHVRGMSPAGVFTGYHRDDFGGKTYIELSFVASAIREEKPTTTQRLDEAMAAIGAERYEEALAFVADSPSCRLGQVRRIELEALRGLGRKEQLLKVLDPPQNVDEAVELISLLLEADRFEAAASRLEESKSLIPSNVFNDLKANIAVRRMAE